MIQTHKPTRPKAPGKLHRQRRSFQGGGELYNLQRWRRLRKMYLRRHPLCADPYGRHGEVGEIATEVDHVVPWSTDANLAFDSSNLQSLCKRCHARKSLHEFQVQGHGGNRKTACRTL
jgi:5-methylcytosine-specific restriction protein A